MLPSVCHLYSGRAAPGTPLFCGTRREGDKPEHRMTPNMISLDLKGHAGLFAELSGTLRDDSRVLQPCSSLCTLPVMAFVCGNGGLHMWGWGPEWCRPAFCVLWRLTEANWLLQDPGCSSAAHTRVSIGAATSPRDSLPVILYQL